MITEPLLEYAIYTIANIKDVHNCDGIVIYLVYASIIYVCKLSNITSDI